MKCSYNSIITTLLFPLRRNNTKYYTDVKDNKICASQHDCCLRICPRGQCCPTLKTRDTAHPDHPLRHDNSDDVRAKVVKNLWVWL
jgi:hypothetical protein